MLEWTSLIANCLWLVGLAILLAGFSYHYWLAQRDSRLVRRQLQQPDFRRLAWLGLVLVAIGLAATSRALWEAAVWSLAAALALGRLAGLSGWRPAGQFRMADDNQKEVMANLHEENQDTPEPRAPDNRPVRPLGPDSAT